MAKAFKSAKITQARPKKGDKPSVKAEFEVSPAAFKVLGASGIIKALKGTGREIKKIISRSMVRAYKASGLRIISGDLLANATQNFMVRINMRGKKITVLAIWNAPDIEYFFYHLFGFNGTRSNGAKVNYKGRPFLRFDKEAGVKILKLMNKVLVDAFGEGISRRKTDRIKEQKRRARERGPAEGIIVQAQIQNVETVARRGGKSIRKVSQFKARKRLRRQGVSASEARRRVAELESQATSAIEELAQNAASGGLLSLLRIGITLGRAVIRARREVNA